MPIENADQFKRIGKYISLILRHEPEIMGVKELPPGGWVSVDQLLATVNKKYKITKADLDQLVAENNKQRYSYDFSGKKIRANQGHSVEVDLELSPAVPVKVLFHGTIAKSVDAIKEEGLKKMYRHAVHLSVDPETAENVGSRRGKAVILKVKAHQMHEDGYVFYKSDNGVWLTDSVPVQYIEFP